MVWMGLHPVTKTFMTAWFTTMTLVWLVAMFKMLPSGSPVSVKLVFCFPPPILGVMGI